MIEEFIPIVAIAMPLSIPIVWIVLNYRKRRRLMELSHAERMAAIERGMDVPPLPVELLDGGSQRRRRTTLLPGLVWFFIGLTLLAGILLMHEHHFPLIGALVPLGVGLAYLIYYFTEGKALEARWIEHDLQQHSNSKPVN
jgi:uncharacterized protein DUF6249